MKYTNYRNIFRFYEYVQPFLKYSTPLEEKLPGNKVVVIAPHQDDEAIGCGGTVLKHVKSGGKLEIIFCTHDTQSRMEEAKQSAKILGSKISHFLQFDNKIIYKQTDALSESFTKLFLRIEPDIIFMPFAIDNHPTHVAISKAFLKAYKQKTVKSLIYAYSIWTTLIPNVTVDISDVWAEKQKAIECYKSQLAGRDYIKMATSMAQYWAVVKGKNIQYCEAFLKMTAKSYVNFVRDIF